MEENKKNKIPNVPNLGFGDASYLATKIRDVSNVVSGGTPDTSNPNYWDGEINWFTPSEIGNSKYVENSKRRITSLGYKNCGAKLMSPGSILLSSRATVGDASISKTECCTNQGFQSLTDFKCCGQYLYYYLQTFQIHKSLIRRASGSTFLEISNYEVGNTDIFIPDLNTQEKIAIFLSKIDDRIETQNKIIKDNKTFKNQLTEKLIYKNSDVIYIALSNYCCLKNGYSFKSDCYSENGEYSIVTIGNVQGERYLNLEGAKTINTLPNDIQKHQILQKGDILVSLTGNVGRVSIVNKDNCLLNQRVGLLSFIDSKHIEYIFQCLSSPRFEMEMTRKGQGAAQLNLGTNDVASYKIPMRKNNADLVAKLLKKIDEKIILEEQINNLLKKQKQFLLANLFI